MTEDDEKLRELLRPRGHSWVSNGLRPDEDDEEEDMPVPIYGAPVPYPPGVTSVRDMEIVEVEGPMLINRAIFKGRWV
jgi:hypothetical protein